MTNFQSWFYLEKRGKKKMEFLAWGKEHLFLLAFLIFLACFSLWQYRLLRRYRKLLAFFSQAPELEKALFTCAAETRQVLAESKEWQEKYRLLENLFQKSICQVGLIRYNAFARTGGDLSFSLALLDAKGNGVVLTSLCGRNETRVFAKPLKEGQSPYPLTEEEKEAISQARMGKPELMRVSLKGK